jgi:hypothetical protein
MGGYALTKVYCAEEEIDDGGGGGGNVMSNEADLVDRREEQTERSKDCLVSLLAGSRPREFCGSGG